jgi:hypothetical protein
MLGGRLYDSATLNEVATGSRKRQPYWWEQAGTPATAGDQAVAQGRAWDGD